jgi:hypothetical protein
LVVLRGIRFRGGIGRADEVDLDVLNFHEDAEVQTV